MYVLVVPPWTAWHSFYWVLPKSVQVLLSLNKSRTTSLWSSLENPSPNFQTQTICRSVSWPSSVPVSEEAKVLPRGFKRLDLHGAASLFSAQKGKRLKERKKSYCVHLAMIICCNLSVLSPDYCDPTQWNGRGFSILFFVCVIPMSCESFLGT